MVGYAHTHREGKIGFHWKQCSDCMNWGIYFGYCYWDGGYILYVKQVADSGPGSPSNSTLSSWETAAGRVVASCGGRGVSQSDVLFLKGIDVF